MEFSARYRASVEWSWSFLPVIELQLNGHGAIRSFGHCERWATNIAAASCAVMQCASNLFDLSLHLLQVQYGIMVVLLNKPGNPVSILVGSYEAARDGVYHGGDALIARDVATGHVHQLIVSGCLLPRLHLLLTLLLPLLLPLLLHCIFSWPWPCKRCCPVLRCCAQIYHCFIASRSTML